MDTTINDALDRSMSYKSYRDLVKSMAENNSTTGIEKTEVYADFTVLNDKRMKRWDKTLKISEELEQKILEFKHPITWLVIAESWCGDGAHILPVLNKIAELNEYIDLKIVLKDENPQLMDSFLTFGTRSIPKVIMIDNESGAVLNTYGPRPSEATAYVNRFKAKYGKLTPEFKEDLQHWYNKNKGQNIIEDVAEMLCKLEPTVCQ